MDHVIGTFGFLMFLGGIEKDQWQLISGMK